MVRPYLSVIIPVFNEGKRLPLTLIDVDRHLADQDFSYEIIVVSSPSTDNTPEIMRRFQQLIKHLKCLTLIENQGRGLAVKTGMLAAKGTWRLVMDADNSISIVEFLKMRPYLRSGQSDADAYDIVLGSRYMPGANLSSQPPLTRRIASSLGRGFLSLFLTRGIHDPNCGFKCFSSESAEKLFVAAKTTGWALDAEVLSLARKNGYRIKEVPVFYSYDAGTKRTARSYPKIALEFLSVWGRGLPGHKK